jgi:hypothetical protein
MKRVPGALGAIVTEPKIRGYLLDGAADHGKARLFESFGFRRSEWRVLMAAMQQHVVNNSVVAESVTIHGRKFVVQCNLPTPDGRNPCITSVWMIDAGAALPRLVTAYGGPLPGA